MNFPRLQTTLLLSIAFLIPLCGFSPELRAQPLSPPAEAPPEIKKAQPVPRVKPQVIYRVPRVSGNGAALHAQAKADNNALPIDASMPISLQMARAAANAEAAQAQAAQTSPSPTVNPGGANPQVRRPRQRIQKGNFRSIAPRQSSRPHGMSHRGGGGYGRKKK